MSIIRLLKIIVIFGLGCIGVFLCMAVAASWSESTPPIESEEQLAVELIEKAKTEVTRRLKSPSTAKFPGTVFGRNEFKVYAGPDGSYGVFSWVDAQNAFGAMIRSQWAVTFKRGGERWEVLKVSVE